jgi:glycosyltransferase involved in cell wall biosynthesis
LTEQFKKLDVEILVSTMNRDSLDFLIPMFPFCHFSEFSILIVNQTLEDKLLASEFPTVRVINSFEKGLSRSRNLALKNAAGKIVLIADDDVIYEPNFEDIIINSFNKYPNAAAITFSVKNDKGDLFKNYPKKEKKLITKLDVFQFMSVEIALNNSLFQLLNRRFDERFGLGAKFSLSEENILMHDLLQLKQPLFFVPEVILLHPANVSDTKLGFIEKYYIQGAFLARIDGEFYIDLCLKLFFDLKQKKLKVIQLFSAIKSANSGKNDFYNLENEIKNNT